MKINEMKGYITRRYYISTHKRSLNKKIFKINKINSSNGLEHMVFSLKIRSSLFTGNLTEALDRIREAFHNYDIR